MSQSRHRSVAVANLKRKGNTPDAFSTYLNLWLNNVERTVELEFGSFAKIIIDVVARIENPR